MIAGWAPPVIGQVYRKQFTSIPTLLKIIKSL